ncbi:MAG: HEAT repeat domain-containing protein, partial [Planctomycetota bacterium]|nr:HEAT repeat domain-containing protein [Planctomycetota bacterium]
ERALEMSRIAMDTPHPGSLARLSRAYALRMNEQDGDAIELLEPLSLVDQLAALELARAYFDLGKRSRALTVLHKAATLQYSGIAYDMIGDILREHGELPPKRPSHSRIVKSLKRFDRRVLDYHKRPKEFLSFNMRFENLPIAAARPVNVVLHLQNVGAVPISFGDGYMARPLVAMSVRIGKDPGKLHSNYLQVMMNSRRILMPGGTIQKTVAIDIGPIREQLIRSAARPQTIEVSALFDPVYRDGELSSGLGTISADPIVALRDPIDTGRDAIAASIDSARSGDTVARIEVTDAFGALLAAAKSETSTPALEGVDLGAIRETLASLLVDHDWRVRAHAIVACGWSPLHSTLTLAAAGAVRDENAVVRMLAVRLFAEQQGEKFLQVLEELSKGDPDRLVRIMARSFVQHTGVAANRVDTAETP